MRLLRELNEDYTTQILTEESSGKKNYFIESIWMQGDVVNRNKRNYPFKILENAANKYIKEKVSTRRAMGELGHPEGPSINMDRVSHIIESLKKDGTNYVGKAKILNTPYGQIVKAMMDENVKFGVSSRGLGSVKPNKQGINEVQNDFFIATAGDIVADPSAPDAFVSNMMEGAEWTWNNGILVQEDMEKIQNNVNKAFRSVDQKKHEAAILEAWETLLKGNI